MESGTAPVSAADVAISLIRNSNVQFLFTVWYPGNDTDNDVYKVYQGITFTKRELAELWAERHQGIVTMQPIIADYRSVSDGKNPQ